MIRLGGQGLAANLLRFGSAAGTKLIPRRLDGLIVRHAALVAFPLRKIKSFVICVIRVVES